MKNLAEYITEAGFDSNAQISKNREIINKYFTDFTISAAFPIKKQKNYKKYFDYMYRCEISKKEEIDKFYDALCRMYDETGQEYKQKDIDRRKEIALFEMLQKNPTYDDVKEFVKNKKNFKNKKL